MLDLRTWLGRATVAGLATASLAAQTPSTQRPGYVERVEVARVIVDVRVTDGRGQPIRDLGPAHFRARIDGEPVGIEAVRWESGQVDLAPPIKARETTDEPASESAAAGRLIVFFIQKSFEGTRMVGLMQMLPRADDLVSRLGPSDYVAVVSFDSHLRRWLDFTRDRARLRRVLEHDLLLSTPPASHATPAPPSLFERLDPDRARRAGRPEDALEAVADALSSLPGSKSLVLLAYGFGVLGNSGVAMIPAYDRARDALLAARVTVFAIDVTQADYHSLQVGLETVAEDTGGFYASAFLFPGLAINHLERALAGHYVLVIENPQRRRGRHRIDIDLVGRRGTVIARNTFLD